MMRTHYLLLPAILAVPALGQKAELTVKPQKDQALRYQIETQSTSTQSRVVLIDGEEGGFGGRGGRGGGGGGETVQALKVEFDEGPGWRHYRALEATDSRVGRDGEPVDREVKGALTDKKVFLRAGEGGEIALFESDEEDAEAVSAVLSRGVPGQVSVAGFLPGKEVAVGEEFDLSGSLQQALRGLVHPVTPEPTARQGGGGQRGQGGGQRGGGQRGMRGGRGGTANPMAQMLTRAKLTCESTGVLESIKDNVAVVTITAKLHGKGTPAELGLGGRGGRGGRGGGGGGGGEGTASALVEIQGKVLVDLDSHQITSIDLGGKLSSDSETKRETQRGDMEMKSSTKGSFKLKATCKVVEG